MTTTEVWEWWRLYCDEQGWQTGGREALFVGLKVFYPWLKRTVTMENGHQVSRYTGIDVVEGFGPQGISQRRIG